MDTSASAAYRNEEKTFDASPLLVDLEVRFPDGTPFERVSFSTRTSLLFNGSIRNEIFLGNGETIDESIWIKGATIVRDGVRTLVTRIGIDCIVREYLSEDRTSWRLGPVVRRVDATLPDMILDTDAEDWQTSGDIEGFPFLLKLRKLGGVVPTAVSET
jgi:hypothetical protein